MFRIAVFGVFAALGTLPLLAAAPSRAQAPDHPPYMPTRDVKVVYDVQPQGAPSPQRVTVWFADNGGLMRIDSPNGQGETILDRDRKLLTVVMKQNQAYMQLAERESLRSPFLLDSSMQFARDGSGSVAGLACTRWKITAQQGKATACITPDGVVLSEAGVDSQGARGQLTARTVTYGALPAAAFLPPPGYKRVAHPAPSGQGGNGSAQRPTLGAASGNP